MLDCLYILDSNFNPVKANSVYEFAEFFKSDRRIIKQDNLHKYKISTVFLGTANIFFETMVFPLESYTEIECCRVNTYQEALTIHQEMIDKYAIFSNEFEIY